VTTQDLWPQLARRLGLSVARGALVVKAEGDGPAKSAGLSGGSHRIEFQGQPDIPADGDVIVGIEGAPVRDSSEVGRVIARHRPGDRVGVQVLRGQRRRTVIVTLGVRPSKPGAQ